jgi:DNA end-binding protein Ku
MARTRRLLFGLGGLAALAASVAAIRYSRGARLPAGSGVPPPPPSRPPSMPPTSPAPAEKSTATRSGGTAAPMPPRELDSMNKEQLYKEARRKGIPGRSKMNKDELLRALSKA